MSKKGEEVSKETFNKEYVAKLLKKYPEKVPVIFIPGSGTPTIDKRKFLIPRDLLVSQLIYIIRQKIMLKAEQAIFLRFGNNIPNTNSLLSEAYEMYKDENGMLYATYCTENTFG